MLLQIKDLRVSLKNDSGTVKAVRGIDLNIGKNEVVGLVGESGSGKSMTALSIMRLLPKRDSKLQGNIVLKPHSPEAKDLLSINEEDMRAIRARSISMIFQEPFTSLNPVLTVGQQIDEATLFYKNSSKIDRKVRTLQLLEEVKLSDPERIYSSYPHLLSGGERQRAMIAMATIEKPELLIADEPTTALDVTVQAEILDLILGLRERLGMSILFITHDFGIINKVADRVYVMKSGKIVENGKKNDILTSPKDAYTKNLLDAVIRHSHTHIPRGAGDMVALKAESLSKTFLVEKGLFKRAEGRVEAVKNVNIKIKEGRTLGLVGESGSGKTTVGKLLINLIKPDSGEIKTSLRSETQIVFQDPYSSLDPRMRMQDIVLEGPVIRGVPASEREKLLKDVLSKVHLNYNDRLKYPHQFSGGERQRIAIARALSVKPKILILDEPVSSLDVIIQKGILNLLKELQKELSLTYLFISHDLRVVRHMSDDIAVMKNGEIVEYGTREEVYESPKHPYTKRLLASIPELYEK